MVRTRGFTMLEVMFVVAIFTLVTGVLFTVSFSFGSAVEVQEIRAVSNDELRKVLLEVVRELRQARHLSIDFDALPATSITFQVPEDLDGNGTAVDQGLQIELGPPVWIGLDANDENVDTLTSKQLIRRQQGQITVLANNLATPGAFDAPETEINGIWFEAWGAGIKMTLVTEGRDRRQRAYRKTFEQVIMPRN